MDSHKHKHPLLCVNTPGYTDPYMNTYRHMWAQTDICGYTDTHPYPQLSTSQARPLAHGDSLPQGLLAP